MKKYLLQKGKKKKINKNSLFIYYLFLYLQNNRPKHVFLKNSRGTNIIFLKIKMTIEQYSCEIT
jgi:transcriptional accessory protein Tex/SPT6